MNITQIMVMLQMALSLLMSPQAKTDPVFLAKAEDFVYKAITLAQEEIKRELTTPTEIETTPSTNIPQQDMGTASAPVIQPSCSLSVSRHDSDTSNYTTTITWTSQGVESPTSGIIYAGDSMAAGVNYYDSVVARVSTSEGMKNNISNSSFYKMVLGDAVCYGKL